MLCIFRNDEFYDSQVYVSQTKAKGLNRPFKDGRSVVAKRYQEATAQGKPAMAANMMKRAGRRPAGKTGRCS